MGLVGLPISVFFTLGAFFMSLPATAAGWRTLRVLSRDRVMRETLAWHLAPVVIASGAGIVLGLAGVVFMGLHFLSLLERR